jgi:hypothetical protein
MIFSENRLPRFKITPAASMIAPTARGCKRVVIKMYQFSGEFGRHGIVSGITMMPHFRQADAVGLCE